MFPLQKWSKYPVVIGMLVERKNVASNFPIFETLTPQEIPLFGAFFQFSKNAYFSPILACKSSFFEHTHFGGRPAGRFNMTLKRAHI